MSTEPAIYTPPQDPSPYIRTFAKDFAALSGKPPVIPASRIAYGRTPKKQSLQEAIETTSIIHADETSVPENIDLPRIETGDIVTQVENPPEVLAPEPLPVPVPPPEEVPIPPPPTVPEPPVEIIPEPLEVPFELPVERESILSRLKARADKNALDMVQSEPGVEVETKPQKSLVIGIQAPESAPAIGDSIPGRNMHDETPVPAVIEIPSPPPRTTVSEPVPLPPPESPTPIHTFTSDFADRIDEKQASTFSVLAAQSDAAPIKSQPVKKKIKVLPLLMGVLLVLLGTGALGGAYWYMTKNAPVPIIASIPSIIPADAQVKLSGTGSTLMQALAHQETVPLAPNAVTLTYVTEATTTVEGTLEAPATGGAFIHALQLPAPDILIRNIDPSSMVGILNANGDSKAFFILRVTSYERTFSGMLKWEQTMLASLAPLYPTYPAPNAPTGSATSTNPVPPLFLPTPLRFTDEVVSNFNTRVLKDSQGHALIIYGYVDRETLIIARNETAFTMLASRIKVQ